MERLLGYYYHDLSVQVSAWINEKLKVAEDESYRDPTNLQSKLQKHNTFEAELSANKGRLDAVCKVALSLCLSVSVHLSVCLFIYLSVSIVSICLFVPQSVSHSVSLLTGTIISGSIGVYV